MIISATPCSFKKSRMFSSSKYSSLLQYSSISVNAIARAPAAYAARISCLIRSNGLCAGVCRSMRITSSNCSSSPEQRSGRIMPSLPLPQRIRIPSASVISSKSRCRRPITAISAVSGEMRVSRLPYTQISPPNSRTSPFSRRGSVASPELNRPVRRIASSQ